MAAGASPDTTRSRWPALFSTASFLLLLLAVEAFLYFSEQFQWFEFNQRKGFTVLIAAGAVVAAMCLSVMGMVIALLLRRRCQYSLGTMALMAVIIAAVAGWLSNAIRQARSQKEGVREVTNHGGGVSYGKLNSYQILSSIPTSRVIQFQAVHVPQPLRQHLGDDFFGHVSAVNMRGDVPMAVVIDFPEVKQLRVDGPLVTDKEMAYLRGMRKLMYLSLNQSDLTDDGLAQIRTHTQLHTLWLRHTKVTDAGLKHVAELQGLQVLLLDSTRITDQGMKDIVKLTNLDHLSIDETAVTDAGLAELKQLENLRRLSLVGTKITDAGLRDFVKAHPKCEIVH